MGDSLAGSIALLTALTYPTIFSQVAMLSPQYDEVVKEKVEGVTRNHNFLFGMESV